MMTPGKTIAIPILCWELFLLSLTALRAQPSPIILAGPIIEAEGKLAVAGEPISVYSLSSGCGTFDRVGFGTGYRFGAEGRIVPLRWNGFGLTGRMMVEMEGARFTALPPDEQRSPNPSTGELETLEREFRLDYRTTTLAIEPMLSYGENKGWNVAAGIRLGYRVQTSFSQTDNVLGPGDRRFEDGQGAHPMEEGIDFIPAEWSLGPVLGVSRIVALKNGLLLAPQLSLRADLLSPAANVKWRNYSLSAGIAFFFDLSPLPPPPLLPPGEPTPPPVPEIPLPQASVRIYGQDDKGMQTDATTIRAWEVLYEQRLPILPSIFFERESSQIPERYVNDPARSPESSPVVSTPASTNDSLAEIDWTLMKANHHLPGILAERMARNPELILEIAGSTSEEESQEEGKKRSDRVKELLIEQGIPSGRIRIVPPQFKRSDERTIEGSQENRRVEIMSQNTPLTEPVTVRQIVRDFSPPAIRVKPNVEAVAGVREWEIAILYNDSVTARYTNREKAEGKPPDFNWRITQRRGETSIAPIVARFSVTDSLGRESIAYDTIEVTLDEERRVVDRDIEEGISHRRSTLWIIGFDYDSDLLSERQKKEMEIIAERILPGARVTVTGYTDRIGTESYNLTLSERRADAVAAWLRTLLARRAVADVTIEAVGAGVDQGLFDNNLPEGRRLSRSVAITVEQEK